MPKKILVVDDEPGSVLLFESILKKRGYLVTSASDGDEAIRKAREEKPDLIILDIVMPKVDGTEVAQTLKQDPATKNIPIFFITALIAPGDQIDVTGVSSSPVFAKPVNLEELVAKVREQIGS